MLYNQCRMFQPVQLLPLYNPEKGKTLQDRWNTREGERDKQLLLKLINEGAGEDFLQGDFQSGRFSILEDEGDLRGLELWSLDITFPKNDTFEGIIDFSYSKWWHSKFKNGLFACSLLFARIYNCEFKNCTFYMFYSYGTTFEKCKFIDCDFIQSSSFANCRFIDCEFAAPFIENRPFQDCLFDSSTKISDNFEKLKIHNSPSSSIKLESKEVPEIYKSIKDAYLAGEAFREYRKYFFLQKHFERNNSENILGKLSALLQEFSTGYGVKPENTILLTIVVLLFFAFLFAFDTNSTSSPLLLSLAAFATVGNIPENSPFNYLFVVEGFLGIGFFALLITTLANIWFSEK